MAEAARSAEKDPILSHGAHEIRTPVTVILGYLRMLTSERMGPVTEPQRKALGEIQKTAAKLAPLLGKREDELIKKLARRDTGFAYSIANSGWS